MWYHTTTHLAGAEISLIFIVNLDAIRYRFPPGQFGRYAASLMDTILYYMGLMGALIALLVGATIPIYLWGERKLKRELQAAFAGRESLDERAFYERYFQSRGVPAEVVFRIRRILESDLNTSMSRLLPEDDFTGNLKFFFDHDELVSIRIVEDIEKEFGISISDDEAGRMHTVNDIVFGTWEKVRQRAA